MKTLRIPLFILLAFIFGILAAAVAYGQGVEPVVDGEPSLGPLQNTLYTLTEKAPWLLGVLAVMGIMRVIFKPVFAILHTIVDSTDTAKDNELLTKVEDSKITKGIFFVLDWVGSIKIKKPEAPKPPTS